MPSDFQDYQPEAVRLNQRLEQLSPVVFGMLSRLARRLYFPLGILKQGEQAAKSATNATLGIAMSDNKVPMHLSSINQHLNDLSPKDVYPYAPSLGVLLLRQQWQQKIKKDNDSLSTKKMSLPIVSAGITHGLSMVSSLFVDEGDHVLIPNLFWENYEMIFGVIRQAKIHHYRFFDEHNQPNLAYMDKTLNIIYSRPNFDSEKNKVVILFNFPNNPTGYLPNITQVKLLKEKLLEHAKNNKRFVLCFDDAYYGFSFEDGVKQSLFAYFFDLHPNILCVKVDGVTKEQYFWGGRVGFISLAYPHLNDSDELDLYFIMEEKIQGLIRGEVSSCSHISQTLTLQSLKLKKQIETQYNEKNHLFSILKERFHSLKECINSPDYQSAWNVYPFNAGYFTCLQLKKMNAEVLRQYLLKEKGIGVIALDSDKIRIAFSAVAKSKIPDMIQQIYESICYLTKK